MLDAGADPLDQAWLDGGELSVEIAGVTYPARASVRPSTTRRASASGAEHGLPPGQERDGRHQAATAADAATARVRRSVAMPCCARSAVFAPNVGLDVPEKCHAGCPR
ncbi:hypothetical protein [Dactylosporangium darangshiense]|uniref:hypothetical protein n=1 Tax=Dactylosporangium darangshiense TaxID=579108 RepID=UPI003627EAE4